MAIIPESVDIWTAKQCEGEGHNWKVMITISGWTLILNGHTFIPWTIQDARCRQVVREVFKIETETFSDIWQCYHYGLDEFYEGKNIDEAEINCITALWENRQ